MIDDARDITRFLTEIVRLSGVQDYFPFPVEATAMADDDDAIVIYREEAGGRLAGHCFHYPSLAREFDGSSPELVADAIVVNDLADPSGPGAIRRYAWERALVATDEPVHWLSTPRSAGIRSPRSLAIMIEAGTAEQQAQTPSSPTIRHLSSVPHPHPSDVRPRTAVARRFERWR
ncbi:hypothetical protein [Leucobacter chromiiresistens]|uniref:Uncharacterized protein n=1 Tax=Leucobacter chromiiresistens TaxID=1079994 RepID=A0A147EPN6_9MICO|nr:hypothetical protein [Leucobacter chromiiresistens]KTR86338.1 hypothetical protein NS354_05275 [Leucobacter chromiiresistens]